MFSITINVCVRSPFLVSFSIYHSLDSRFHYREYLMTERQAISWTNRLLFTSQYIYPKSELEVQMIVSFVTFAVGGLSLR